MGGRPKVSLSARFNDYVDSSSGDCWPWTGGRYPNGYGKFKIANGEPGGKGVLAHRLAYQLANGRPPEGVVNHTCEVKHCVRPEHLEDVTQSENVRYSLGDKCKAGHELSWEPGHSNTYLTKQGKRVCRACMRRRARERYQKKLQDQ